MEQQHEQIRDQQKETWNKFSPGWKKWDDLTMEFLKPMGNEIIRLLNIKDHDLVLDVAAGTGEPGLTIAEKFKNTKVISTDLSEGMIAVANENGVKRGLKNFVTTVCDVCDLPFPDNTFNSISCRFGFMFFPDMLLAAKEMHRVLKPGGRIATSVWNIPEKNFWITSITSVLSNNIELPQPPPGSPGMFRCAGKGCMEDLLKQAGFKNISEKEINGKLNVRTPEVYWNFMTEVAAPVVAALGKADDQQKEKIKKEVYESLMNKFPDGKTVIDSSAMVIYGEKE
ncbi:MAG: methyltransferase type 11 [Bacteroidota bacterium]|nr:methyltransferase type 11 [Bacteroidota bacterium]